MSRLTPPAKALPATSAPHADQPVRRGTDGAPAGPNCRAQRIRRGLRTRRQLRSVSGAVADMVPTQQIRHRPGLVRVTVMLIERCRPVLTERCRKIAR
jgi:hypothetical protein